MKSASDGELRFLADEGVDAHLVQWMCDRRIDITWSRDVMPGADDKAVLDMAYQQGRVLLTCDKDFGDLIVRGRRPCHGLILLRLHSSSPAELLERFARHWMGVASRASGHLVVVTNESIRSRSLGFRGVR